jgi:hypothetical protein
MKLKRRLIEEQFRSQINALYSKYEHLEVHEHG